MEKKQTAVQFLLSHIADEGKDMIGRDILEQALQMERDQIEEAFVAGGERGTKDIPFNAEQYYTQTFKPEPMNTKNTLEQDISPCNKKITDGSLPLTKEHQCYENGHSFYLVCEIDNGRSKYGDHKCSRCGYVESFQYDYGSW